MRTKSMYVSRLEQELLSTTTAIERGDWDDARDHARHNRDLLGRAEILDYLCENCVLVEHKDGEDSEDFSDVTYERYSLCAPCSAKVEEKGW